MEIVCPRCRGVLLDSSAALRCPPCAAEYPLIAGIPDLRLAADPLIEIVEDREKAARLAREAEGRSLAELVQFYFSITPEVPPDLARGFAAAKTVLGPARAGDRLDAWSERVVVPGQRVIDLGCGAGAWLPELTGRFRFVTGVDVALRWLVVARKALEEVGRSAQLVCANAEHLPFRAHTADAVVAANVIEHVARPESALDEIFRILDKDGVALLSSPNRLSLLPEPHVGVPALGWLPRATADELVRRTRGVPYGGIQLQTWPGLVDLVSAAGFRLVRVGPPAIGPRERATLGRGGRLGAAGYEAVRSWVPGGATLLRVVGPLLEVDAFKGPNRERIFVGRAAAQGA